MRKLIIAFFMFIFLIGCSQSEEARLIKYLDEATSYNISVVYNDRILNIEVPMVKKDEESVQHETLILILAIISYPQEGINLFKEINIDYFDSKTNENIAEIMISEDTLTKVDWKNLKSFTDIKNTVDYYKFKE